MPAGLPAKCHIFQVEISFFWVPDVITVINHSPKDWQCDLSLFISNEMPQQEQPNTAETQGRHPIPGAMLAPVTKPRAQEGPEPLPGGKAACAGQVGLTGAVAGGHL